MLDLIRRTGFSSGRIQLALWDLEKQGRAVQAETYWVGLSSRDHAESDIL